MTDANRDIGLTIGKYALRSAPASILAGILAGPVVGAAAFGAGIAGSALAGAGARGVAHIKEDIDARRRFRQIQEAVLAQNGVLRYNPGNFSCLDRIAKGDFGVAETASLMAPVAVIAAQRVAHRYLPESKFSQTARHVRDSVAPIIGDMITRPASGYGNMSEGCEGCENNDDHRPCASDKELEDFISKLNCEDDPKDRRLDVERFCSFYCPGSAEKLMKMLSEAGLKVEGYNFSATPALDSLVSRDFGVMTSIAAGVAKAVGGSGAKLAGKFAMRNADKLLDAAKANSKLVAGETPIAEHLQNAVKGVKSIFKGDSGIVDKGAEVVKGASDAASNLSKAAERQKAVSGVFEGLGQGSPMNKNQLAGVKLAAGSQMGARLVNTIGVESAGALSRGVQTAASTLTAQEIADRDAKARAEAQQQRRA